MAFPAQTVFTLVSCHAEHRYEVQFWQDYGVVATQLWTTNGHLNYFARLCSEHVAVGTYKVEGSILDSKLDYTNQRALYQALREAYIKWNTSLLPS